MYLIHISALVLTVTVVVIVVVVGFGLLPLCQSAGRNLGLPMFEVSNLGLQLHELGIEAIHPLNTGTHHGQLLLVESFVSFVFQIDQKGLNLLPLRLELFQMLVIELLHFVVEFFNSTCAGCIVVETCALTWHTRP